MSKEKIYSSAPESTSESSKPWWFLTLSEAIQKMMYWQYFEPREKPKKKKEYRRAD